MFLILAVTNPKHQSLSKLSEVTGHCTTKDQLCLGRDDFRHTEHRYDILMVPLSCAISLTLDCLSCCHHLLLVSLQWTKCWVLPGAMCWKGCPLGPISRRLRGSNRPPQHIASKVSLVTSRTTGCTWHCLRQEKRRQLMGVPLHSFLTYLYLAFGLPTG